MFPFMSEGLEGDIIEELCWSVADRHDDEETSFFGNYRRFLSYAQLGAVGVGENASKAIACWSTSKAGSHLRAFVAQRRK